MVAILGTGGKTSGRKSYYGKLVTTNLTFSPCVSNMNPRDIAAAHMVYALPISSEELDCWNMNFIGERAGEVFDQFACVLSTIYMRLHPTEKRIATRSRSILVTSGRNILCAKKSVKVMM